LELRFRALVPIEHAIGSIDTAVDDVENTVDRADRLVRHDPDLADLSVQIAICTLFAIA
jgi:hypothetical protein